MCKRKRRQPSEIERELIEDMEKFVADLKSGTEGPAIFSVPLEDRTNELFDRRSHAQKDNDRDQEADDKE